MNREEPEMARDEDVVSLFSISIGGDLFAIATVNVREVLEYPQMRRVPLAPSHIVGVMPYRGEILTTVSFRALLGRSETQPAGCVIVLEDEQTCELWGLSVDAAHGVLLAQPGTLQPDPLTLDSRRSALFIGMCETSSGPVILLDPNRLKPEQPAAFGAVPQTVEWPGASSRGDSPCAH